MALFFGSSKRWICSQASAMWHGSFRIAEVCEEDAVRLKIKCTPYRLFSVVHISKLKRMRRFLDRPIMLFEVYEPGHLMLNERQLEMQFRIR